MFDINIYILSKVCAQRKEVISQHAWHMMLGIGTSDKFLHEQFSGHTKKLFDYCICIII